MQDKTVWEIKIPAKQQTSSPERNSEKMRRPGRRVKNPAVAFSLSLLIWGGGQFYNRQHKLGFYFLLSMGAFYSVGTWSLLHRQDITAFLRNSQFTAFHTFLASATLYVLGMLVWLLNADQAYRRAARTRSKPYRGTEHPILPPLCSLLFPGWGQILNGQTSKASCFMISAMAGLFSFPAFFVIPQLWAALETPGERLVLEGALVGAVILSPLSALAWLISVFDALRVGLEDIKKEPLRKRVRYALNRIRMYGFRRAVLPQAKLTLMLSLLLSLVLSGAILFWPGEFYTRSLTDLQGKLARNEMVLLPELIARFL